MTRFLSVYSKIPPRQFQPQVIHGLFLRLFGAAFRQVKVYRRANQRMFLAIGKAITIQQIGLLALGQPFQAIVQFPARCLFFHDALRLHGVRVGYGLNAPQLFLSRQNIVQRNTLVTDTMHADEINRAMTEALGREVYHYNLHVVYRCISPRCVQLGTPLIFLPSIF